MNKVVKAQPLANGRLFIEMANGRHGEFDVKPYMRGPFFSALAERNYFNQVHLVFRGIGWPDGQDLGPDTIAAELIEAELTV